MKSVAPDFDGLETTRDRQEPGHARQGVVNRCVKAGYLGQLRMTLAERLYQCNLMRKMIRVVGTDAVKFIQQCPGNPLGLGMLHAVDHAVTDCHDVRQTNVLIEPVDQEIRRGKVIGSHDALTVLLTLGCIAESQICPG